MSDEEWLHSRLPIRAITAWPEVHERLGVAPGSPGAPGSGRAGQPGEDEPSRREAEPMLDVSQTASGDDALTDWQRQWLSFDEPTDESAPDVPVAHDSTDESNWWEGIPAVRQMLLDGLALGRATVLLGENGSGKSTLAEGIAMAYGLAPEGGSTGSRHRTRVTESGLGDQLQIVRNAGAGRGGYFLRAETMHAFFRYLEDNPGQDPDEPLFHQLSHGESFVSLVEVKFKPKRPGLYVLDEPESALSFDNQLRLLRHLRMLMETGRHQIVMATHSPILAALPGATILELDGRGFREVDHDDATLVRQWRHFMNDPASFLDD